MAESGRSRALGQDEILRWRHVAQTERAFHQQHRVRTRTCSRTASRSDSEASTAPPTRWQGCCRRSRHRTQPGHNRSGQALMRLRNQITAAPADRWLRIAAIGHRPQFLHSLSSEGFGLYGRRSFTGRHPGGAHSWARTTEAERSDRNEIKNGIRWIARASVLAAAGAILFGVQVSPASAVQLVSCCGGATKTATSTHSYMGAATPPRRGSTGTTRAFLGRTTDRRVRIPMCPLPTDI